MKKVLVLICTILVSIVVASLYGALHNQLTFTISNEFFTEVLFERFGFVEYGLNTPRLTASIIGIWSVWWIGLYAGLVFGIIGFFFHNCKRYDEKHRLCNCNNVNYIHISWFYRFVLWFPWFLKLGESLLVSSYDCK
ncbi:hypothetical protein B4N84_09365 [Flavobacterium sp. IR1]|nr:hypothetical protein B4N84_09365 [Flavobacterium sp. IR1]